MSIRIRSIEAADFNKVSQLIQKTHKISFGKIYPKKLVEELSKKYEVDNLKKKAEEIEYWVAEGSDNILGIIGLKNNELRTFFVDPDFQGKGIGKKLYYFLENIAKNRKIEKLILEGSPLGQPVYKKLGFTKLREIDKERVGIRYKDAVMEKSL